MKGSAPELNAKFSFRLHANLDFTLTKGKFETIQDLQKKFNRLLEVLNECIVTSLTLKPHYPSPPPQFSVTLQMDPDGNFSDHAQVRFKPSKARLPVLHPFFFGSHFFLDRLRSICTRKDL